MTKKTLENPLSHGKVKKRKIVFFIFELYNSTLIIYKCSQRLTAILLRYNLNSLKFLIVILMILGFSLVRRSLEFQP